MTGFRLTTSLLVLAFSLAAFGADSSTGPARPGESAILLDQAQKDLARGHTEAAMNRLERLVARFPGEPQFLPGHLWLGRAYMAHREPKKALSPLRFAVQGYGISAQGMTARAELADAYLASQRPNEVLQVAREIHLLFEKQKAQASDEANALLTEAEAENQLGRIEDAHGSVLAASKLMDGQTLTDSTPNLQSRRAWVLLVLATDTCSKILGSDPSALDEGQVNEAMRRRGDCLASSLTQYRTVLKLGLVHYIDRASENLEKSFTLYNQACLHPPTPRGKRSAAEQKRYLAELKLLLRKTCREKSDFSLSILDSWKNDTPSGSSAKLASLIEAIRGARSF